MITAIIVAEAAFWVLLLGGLALRYLARARRLSAVVLAAVPLVDLALLILVAVDVMRGAEPTRPRAFAALYLGITIAFGRHIIQRTDSWFRYRFAHGPRATLLLLPIITVVWFLAGPAFAGRGDPARDRQPDG